MDTLRMLLISALIGATVATGAVPTEGVTTGAAQGAAPTPQIIYVTPQVVYVTPAPTARTSTASASSSSSSSSTSGYTRQLSRGSTGDDVRAVQRLLKNLGYSISVDGVFGSQMRNVVIQFQKNNGLAADGIVGSRTYRKLTSSSAAGPSSSSSTNRTTLSYGMRGTDVLELQIRLQELGYYFDLCSGNYLTNTRNAVSWFQMINGLYVDGIAGPATLSRVYSSSAIPAHGAMPTTSPTSPAATSPVTIWRTLYQGLSGEDVGQVQRRLAELGYYNGSITNYFGSATAWAVRTFQTYNGLSSDGIVGAFTSARLFSGSAIAYPGGGTLPTATAGPTATATTAPGTTLCQYCGQAIVAGSSVNHNLAVCGQHGLCQTSLSHTLASCGHGGHYNCDGANNHIAADCGEAGHYKCDNPNNHYKLACGLNHWACKPADNPTDLAHTRTCTRCGAKQCSAPACTASEGHNFQ